MKKTICILCVIAAVWLFGCQKDNSSFEKQIRADLIGMLHNKVVIENFSIKEVAQREDGMKQVKFDCQLHFTDNLYKDNGELAFKKDLKVLETDNLFIYSANNDKLKLEGFEFGKTTVLSN